MTNAIIGLAILFNAVCQVENPSGKKGVHSDGHSYGVAGITQGCLDDVNKSRSTGYTLADMDNALQAYLVFVAYTDLRCQIKRMEPTPRNRLLVWHAASDPAEQERYVKAVETELTREDVKR